MSHLVNLADDVYEELTKIKKQKNLSYSKILRETILEKKSPKTKNWADFLKYIKELEVKYPAKKKEKIDIDKIVYGVSRDGS